MFASKNKGKLFFSKVLLGTHFILSVLDLWCLNVYMFGCSDVIEKIKKQSIMNEESILIDADYNHTELVSYGLSKISHNIIWDLVFVAIFYWHKIWPYLSQSTKPKLIVVMTYSSD